MILGARLDLRPASWDRTKYARDFSQLDFDNEQDLKVGSNPYWRLGGATVYIV